MITEHQEPLKESLAEFPERLIEYPSGGAVYCIGYGRKEVIKIPIELCTKQIR